MPRFLIEIPHDPQPLECAKIVQTFLSTGSHLLTNAEWGCLDGCHCAWLTVDIGSREEALQLVPPALRGQARIVGLNRFDIGNINAFIEAETRR